VRPLLVCVQSKVQSETVIGVYTYSVQCRVRLLLVCVQCAVESLTLHCALYTKQ